MQKQATPTIARLSTPPNATKADPPYDHQATETALAWAQQALSATDPTFEVLSSKRHDIHGSIIATHGLNVETQTDRWYGRVGGGSADILCADRETFEQGLKQQGLRALYDESSHHDLQQRITGSDYGVLRAPTAIAVPSNRRLLYRYGCNDCSGTGSQSCRACTGQREMRCAWCSGCGDETCHSCGGSGQQEVGHSDSHGQHHPEWANCPRCNGAGRLRCSVCGGSGWDDCNDCHGTGASACSSCHGEGSFTDIGQITLLHTPHYQVHLDTDAPNHAYDVIDFFGQLDLSAHGTVTMESQSLPKRQPGAGFADMNPSASSATLTFRYRFQIPMVRLKVKSCKTFLGDGDFSEWTVAGKSPQLVDCAYALFPLLVGSSFSVQRCTRWRSMIRPGFNAKLSTELAQLLKPALHRWIIELATRQMPVEDIERQLCRALDPNRINEIIATVTRALIVTYRRRVLLHQAAAVVIMMFGLFAMHVTADQSTLLLFAQASGRGNAVMLMSLVAVLISFLICFHYRHRAWLTRAGGAELRAGAASLGHLNISRTSLPIAVSMIAGALIHFFVAGCF